MRWTDSSRFAVVRLPLAVGLTVATLLGVVASGTLAQETTGNLAITSLWCEVDTAAGEPTGGAFAVDGPGGSIDAPLATTDCAPAAADFQILLYGDPVADPIDIATDEVGVAYLEGALPTTDGAPHTLVDLTSGDWTSFEIAAGELTVIDVTSYIPLGTPAPAADETDPDEIVPDETIPAPGDTASIPVDAPDPVSGDSATGEATATGDVAIAARACLDTGGTGTRVAVALPSFEAVAAAPEATDGCAPSAIELVIYPFGDRTVEPLAVATDATGLLVLDDQLPVTDPASPHLLVDVASGQSAPFEVAADQITLLDVAAPARSAPVAAPAPEPEAAPEPVPDAAPVSALDAAPDAAPEAAPETVPDAAPAPATDTEVPEAAPAPAVDAARVVASGSISILPNTGTGSLLPATTGSAPWGWLALLVTGVVLGAGGCVRSLAQR